MAEEKQNQSQPETTPSTKPTPHQLRRKGEPRFMPPDYSISLGAKGGTDQQLLNPGVKRRQSMRGFEDTYVDIIDYIVRITHRIWEEKDIGYIYDTYSHNANVHDDDGLVYGRDQVVANTVQTINAFPDIRIYADEIIWAGDDEVGFHTSHRGTTIAYNTGYSQYGPPTGKKVICSAIANCIALNNEIFDEWVIYDTASVIQQLGFDLRSKAREIGNQRDWGSLNDQRFGEPERLPGQGKPLVLSLKKTGSFDVEDFIRTTYHNIWNRRMLATVQQAYTPTLTVRACTNRVYHGRGEYQSFILSMLAMFSDLALQVDDIYWMGNDQDGYNVAVRWSIQGAHRGPGLYGPPTGRPVYMWGISQHRIKNSQITEEWLAFNEFSVMQQIYRD
jgi:predicted ester cyclase